MNVMNRARNSDRIAPLDRLQLEGSNLPFRAFNTAGFKKPVTPGRIKINFIEVRSCFSMHV